MSQSLSILNTTIRSFFIVFGTLIWIPSILSCAMGRDLPPKAMSLQELQAYCGIPLPCHTEEIFWEGETVRIQGFIDTANVFDKKRYPQLLYEKFKLTDGQGRSIEVWPQAADNRMIFAKIDSRALDLVIVHGRLASFKAPITGKCNLGVNVLIDDTDQIEF